MRPCRGYSDARTSACRAPVCSTPFRSRNSLSRLRAERVSVTPTALPSVIFWDSKQAEEASVYECSGDPVVLHHYLEPSPAFRDPAIVYVITISFLVLRLGNRPSYPSGSTSGRFSLQVDPESAGTCLAYSHLSMRYPDQRMDILAAREPLSRLGVASHPPARLTGRAGGCCGPLGACNRSGVAA